MNTASLTDRYVDAAMRTVPERQRADLGAELRASIADQIDARVEAGEGPDAAERAVLVELGDPDVLAAGYTERPLWLIGPRYYLDWWRLLKLLLWIVIPCAAFGVALGKALSGATFGDIVGTTVVTILMVVVHLGFWTTLVFAILERTAAGPLNATAWTPESLPEPRDRGAGFGEMVATLVWLAILAGAILWDQFVGFVPGEPGLSFFAPELWPWWIAGLFLVLAAEAVVAVVVYARGRWSIGLATANTVLNAAVAVPAIWLLTEGRLVNPEFWSTVFPDSADELAGILGVIVGFAIAGTAIWSSIDGFLKATRARSGRP